MFDGVLKQCQFLVYFWYSVSRSLMFAYIFLLKKKLATLSFIQSDFLTVLALQNCQPFRNTLSFWFVGEENQQQPMSSWVTPKVNLCGYLKFSLGPAPRPGRVMVLMCVSVCLSVCLFVPSSSLDL